MTRLTAMDPSLHPFRQDLSHMLARSCRPQSPALQVRSIASAVLVSSAKGHALVNPGLDFYSREGQLSQGLEKWFHVQPKDINAVVLGSLRDRDAGEILNKGRMTFPNAKHFVSSPASLAAYPFELRAERAVKILDQEGLLVPVDSGFELVLPDIFGDRLRVGLLPYSLNGELGCLVDSQMGRLFFGGDLFQGIDEEFCRRISKVLNGIPVPYEPGRIDDVETYRMLVSHLMRDAGSFFFDGRKQTAVQLRHHYNKKLGVDTVSMVDSRSQKPLSWTGQYDGAIDTLNLPGLEVAWSVDQGARPQQQDRILVHKADQPNYDYAFSLWDGHGQMGKALTEFVSRSFVKDLDDHFELLPGDTIEDALPDIFPRLEASVLEFIERRADFFVEADREPYRSSGSPLPLNFDTIQRRRYQSSGSTGLVVLLEGNNFYLSHIGDSRAYHLSETGLQVLTKDHGWPGGGRKHYSLLARMIGNSYLKQKLKARDEAAEAGKWDIHPEALKLNGGDFLLLCSDGLISAMKEDELSEVLRTASTAKEATHELMARLTYRAGDNFSILVIKKS